jgi:hypothetical protein
MTFLFLFEVPDGSTAATLRRTSLFICSSRHQQKEKKTKKRAFDFGTRRTRERREKKQNERQNEWKHGRRKRQLCRKSRFGAGTRFASQRTRALFERARALFFFGFSFLPRRRRHRLSCVTSLFAFSLKLLFFSHSVRRQKTWR